MAIFLNPKDAKDTVKVDAKKTYTVKELKQMCKDKGLSSYSKLKEAELIELLEL